MDDQGGKEREEKGSPVRVECVVEGSRRKKKRKEEGREEGGGSKSRNEGNGREGESMEACVIG